MRLLYGTIGGTASTPTIGLVVLETEVNGIIIPRDGGLWW